MIKKLVLIFILLCSTTMLGEEKVIPIRKVDMLLADKQEIKDRLEILKEKERYILKLEENFNEEKIKIDLDKKYKKLEKKYLRKDFKDLDNKKEFLEFEKKSYKELSKRLDNIKNKI